MVRTVIREAFGLYRRLWRQLIPTTALIFLPYALVLLALTLLVPETTSTQQSLAILDAAGSLLLFAPLASIVSIRCGIAADRGDAPSVRPTLGEAFTLLPSYVGTQLLTLLVIAFLPGVLLLAGYTGNSQLLVAVGAGTLLASAILNGIRLSIATILVATGDARFARALRGSAQLTRGRFWGVLGVVSLLGLISLAVGLVFSAAVLGAPAGAIRAVLDAAAGVVVNAITLPLITLGLYRAYVNLHAANAKAREGAQP